MTLKIHTLLNALAYRVEQYPEINEFDIDISKPFSDTLYEVLTYKELPQG